MLTPDYLQYVADDAVNLYSKLEERIIKDIARRIIGAGTMTESARWQIKISQESGKLYEEIIEEIIANEEISKEQLQVIFEEASVEALNFDDNIYKAAGLNPIPIKQSKTMLNILSATLLKTNKELHNLTMTTADAAQEKFLQACDDAYLDVISGAFDYNTAIFNAIEKISKDGLEVIYPSGRRDKIDVAVRRNVLTGVSQTTGKIQETRLEEMKCDLVETSAHAGARPTHSLWQGQVFSRSGTSKKYPDFISSTGYGTISGLMGINCRHSFYPFYEDISRRAYSDEELEKINNETVNYNGKHIKIYEATQIQRSMERKIRQDKREIAGYEGILLASKNETVLEEVRTRLSDKKAELKQDNKLLADFVNETGLARDRARERLNKFNKSLISNKSTSTNKNDIMTPAYIRKNVAKGYDAKEEEQIINNAINVMPEKLKADLKASEFEIITKGMTEKDNSRYDRKQNKFYIYEGADIYEVIHEIGHYVETKYNIINDNKYITIRNKGLENYWAYAVRDIPGYKDTVGITHSKFVSEIQGCIYKKDLSGKSYVDKGAKINLNCLGEYFSEGFREYYQNRNNLKSKDIDLFNFIEDVLKNDK